MQQSTLRQVLTIFETATAPLSLSQVARELGISVERLESMVQYWVRKGKLKESVVSTECGSCGQKGSCAFVVEMPHTYELADDNLIPLYPHGAACCHKGGK
ncbi:MAG: FeoC-like transcriptional regulator [Caldilineales bacterium]|nr:FeoC-like transcriptional regulator [Caldilineales bacterium]MDW8317156.1 FeoC-like transcriptional regulator [Anaerolineae bacterium]